ncbi:hypothetical protein HGA64_01475 [Candidatus Falkowbacteria bacterium]|nr:hypothetical protein [Candidatus Falkowbacteria bacterium]
MNRTICGVNEMKQAFPGFKPASDLAYIPLIQAVKDMFFEQCFRQKPESKSLGYEAGSHVEACDLSPLGVGNVKMLVRCDDLEMRYLNPLYMARELQLSGNTNDTLNLATRFCAFLKTCDFEEIRERACQLIKNAGNHYILIDVRRYFSEA